VNVAIIDVGSNSIRLLVAQVERATVEQLHRERVYLRLGDDAYRLGRISSQKLDETREVGRRFARAARKHGAERLETIVTAPGRQSANHEDLVNVLEQATGAPVVVLSSDEEGRLAWEGAVSRLDDPPEIVAVVDLGGGSCELAVGTPTLGPAWVRSIEAGALRVTRAYLSDDLPAATQLERARHAIRLLVAELEPPRPDVALAVGGTARGIGRVLGKRFGAGDLDDLAFTLATDAGQSIVESHGVTPERAETLLGGTLVLAAVAGKLDTPLQVSRSGLREGAALALARAEAAAA
jgi:exopolyphosphatase / guanosine-5'-triphosphate,3'-diphosphate pyrophosphatase